MQMNTRPMNNARLLVSKIRTVQAEGLRLITERRTILQT